MPDGAYYVLCTTGALDPAQDSSAFARRMVVDPGVAVVPGTDFLAPGRVRLSYATSLETIEAVLERLRKL